MSQAQCYFSRSCALLALVAIAACTNPGGEAVDSGPTIDGSERAETGVSCSGAVCLSTEACVHCDDGQPGQCLAAVQDLYDLGATTCNFGFNWVVFRCDGPEDCDTDEACAAVMPAGAGITYECTSLPAELTACHVNSDCDPQLVCISQLIGPSICGAKVK